MNLKYWLLLSAAASSAGLLSACVSHIDSCEARRTCVPGGAVGGKSSGGDVGAAGEAGGVEEGGGGRGSGGSNAPGGDDAGSAGEGGEGGSPDAIPVLFGACSVKGTFACVEQASAQRLACDGEHWQAGTTCSANQLCDSSNGKCALVVAECASAKPGASFCRKDTRLTCGADLVTANEVETCAGLCKLGVCQLPTCGDEKVESGEDCDDPAAAASGACVNCKTARCGDNVIYPGPEHEQCDDGNLISGDGCSATCRAEPVALALGDSFTCALSSTGVVKCWGSSSHGQLGLGNTESRGGKPNTVPSKLGAIDLGTGHKVLSISAGGAAVCALLETGEVKCWGNNLSGQLGTGDTNSRGDGPGEMGDALKPVSLGSLKVIDVSVGGVHTCVLLAGGSVKCWGSAQRGQLGQGNLVDSVSPKDLAPIKLRLPATAISASSFVDYGPGGSWGGATCALLNNGTVQCWGATSKLSHDSANDIDGSSGIGDYAGEIEALPALKFEGGLPASSIAAGNASAVILNDGSLRLWGDSPIFSTGPVGVTPAELASLAATQMGKKVKSIAIEKRRACAVLEGGALKCWGEDSQGALGLGTIQTTQGAPKDLPSVDLGGHGAVRVATGGSHTCAILDDGKVKCWGYNSDGQLGLGDTANRGDTGNKLSSDTTVDLSF